jgi:hypothetical protein
VTAKTRSQGASNRYSGRETEQAVARFLRQSWPDATRAVRTAWSGQDGDSADPGDLHGVPFGVQIKGHQRGAPQFVPGKTLAAIWEEANAQALTSGLPFAVIVEKRQGTQDVARWYAWAPVRLVASLSICAGMRSNADAPTWDQLSPYPMMGKGDALLRMNVCDFLALLGAAGVPMRTPVETSTDVQADVDKTTV